jgi:hypothetical protein
VFERQKEREGEREFSIPQQSLIHVPSWIFQLVFTFDLCRRFQISQVSELPFRQLALRLLRSDSLLLSHSLSPSLSPEEEEALQRWRRDGVMSCDSGSEGAESEEEEEESEEEEKESEEEKERRERRESMERLKDVFHQYDVSKMQQ